MSLGRLLVTALISLLFTFVLYFLSVTPPMEGDLGFTYYRVPQFTADFVRQASLGTIAFLALAVVSATTVKAVVKLIDWLVPKSVIAIGDEIETHRRRQKYRELVLWSVIIAVVVGVLVNVLTAVLLKQ